MTGFDIKNVMTRTWDFPADRDSADVEVFEVRKSSTRIWNLVVLLAMAMKGTV